MNTEPLDKLLAELDEKVRLRLEEHPNDDELLSGNKGEWGEVYTLFRLLDCHELIPCNEDMQKTNTYPIPVISIFRGEGIGGDISYNLVPIDDGFAWEVCVDNTVVKVVSSEIGKAAADQLYKELTAKESSKKHWKAQKVLNYLLLNKLKMPETEKGAKTDIYLGIKDVRAGQNVNCGFSIKSYIGSPPTLFNACVGSTILYEVDGINEDDYKEIGQPHLPDKEKRPVKEIIKMLKKKGAKITDFKYRNEGFYNNLMYIDTNMPTMYAWCVYISYWYDESYFPTILEKYSSFDTLELNNVVLYEYKFKKFLEAVALGMTAVKPWNGEEDANGGFIIVKADGEIVSYHLYNRSMLTKYLYNYCFFDQPSTKKHKYGKLIKDDKTGKYFLTLSAQIRFSSHKTSEQPRKRGKRGKGEKRRKQIK